MTTTIGKVLLCAAVVITTVLAFPVDENIEENLILTAEEEAALYAFNAERDVVFRLFTRKNADDPYIIKFNDSESLAGSFYSNKKATKITIHGWNNDGNSPLHSYIKNAFLNSSDVNIITVDWGAGSNGLYNTAVDNVPKVGDLLAKFIDWLVSKGSSSSNFHLIGHSLGSHVSGFAGRLISKGQLAYITALDPAGPLWGKNSERVRPSDAAYVEAIHTNGGTLGISEDIADNDFYPNGGQSQPGCGININCSHGRSWEFLVYSIDNTNFKAQLCADYKAAMKGDCADLGSLHMGGSKPKKAMGSFYLKTTSTPPYFS